MIILVSIITYVYLDGDECNIFHLVFVIYIHIVNGIWQIQR